MLEKKNSVMPQAAKDLFEGPAKGARVYTVSEITHDIKVILENTFEEIWVEGEVSGFTKTAKGIVFFSLKDSASLLRCVMFDSFAPQVKFEIKDGMKLICFGRIGVYEKDGRYQLYAQRLEPKGIGGLQLALEQLKQKLEKEGLFSPGHKRPIPYLPAKIGLVTSLSGAAIKDILKVLERRFSDIQIIIRPAQVQGEGAKTDISRAIEELNQFNETLSYNQKIEVMIVGRGGGSIEDLWAFNEEEVCRAIYDSKIPVISAVGHERDWSIADLVCDLRAPTPSVAAELVIPRKEDLREKLENISKALERAFLESVLDFQGAMQELLRRLTLGAENILKFNSSELESSGKRLELLNPSFLIKQHKIKIADLARQVYIRLEHFMRLRQAEFSKAAEKLSGLSPLNILGRGYSITFKVPEGFIVKDTKALRVGDIMRTRLHEGEVLSQVREVKGNG